MKLCPTNGWTRGPMKPLFALHFFLKKILYKQLESSKIKSNYRSLIFLYIQADNNFNKGEKKEINKRKIRQSPQKTTMSISQESCLPFGPSSPSAHLLLALY